MRNAFINRILDACEKTEECIIISGDAGLGVFDEFKERYPRRFLNLGVAEQNMMGALPLFDSSLKFSCNIAVQHAIEGAVVNRAA